MTAIEPDEEVMDLDGARCQNVATAMGLWRVRLILLAVIGACFSERPGAPPARRGLGTGFAEVSRQQARSPEQHRGEYLYGFIQDA